MQVKQSNMKSFEELNLKLQQLASVQGKVGWFAGSTYPDGTTVPSVAAQNELGNPEKKIPPRPFMRPAIIENENRWRGLAAKGANRVLEGKATPRDAMEALTSDAQSKILQNIATLTSPPLAPATIAARQERGNNSTKPLIDTSLMYSSLTSVVEDANS